jgi:hypothetical protein
MVPDAMRVFHVPAAPLTLAVQLDEHELENTNTTTTSFGLCVVSLKLHVPPEQDPPSVPCVSTERPATLVTVVVEEMVVVLVVRLVPEMVVVDEVVLVVVVVVVVVFVVELVVEYVKETVLVGVVV